MNDCHYECRVDIIFDATDVFFVLLWIWWKWLGNEFVRGSCEDEISWINCVDIKLIYFQSFFFVCRS